MRRDEAKDVAGVIARWWWLLQPRPDGSGGDRGALARLRRADTPAVALLEPAVIRLYGDVRKKLGRDALDDRETEMLAVIAGVLARVRAAEGPSIAFATALGQPPDHPVMSPLRFGNLMRAREPEDLMRHLRRAVDLLGGRPFGIPQFAADIFVWNDDIRRRWIFQYHQEGAAAPRPGGAETGDTEPETTDAREETSA
jgi:CRISPR type I-E-associated protein CasB/Cse2